MIWTEDKNGFYAQECGIKAHVKHRVRGKYRFTVETEECRVRGETDTLGRAQQLCQLVMPEEPCTST